MTSEKQIGLGLDSPELASHYDMASQFQYEAGQTLAKELDITAGKEVLDVGCGTGLLTSHIAAVVGTTGRAVGIDPLETRVKLAKGRSSTNAEFAVGSVYDLSSFAANSFDFVILNYVLHWVEDKTLALKEIYRVLRPQGRLGIAGGSGEHVPPFLQIRSLILSRKHYSRDAEEAMHGAPRHDRRKDMEDLLRHVGFDSASIFNFEQALVTETAAEMIDWVESSSFGNYFGHLPEPLRRRARDEAAVEFEKLRTDGMIRMQLTSMVVVAVKP